MLRNWSLNPLAKVAIGILRKYGTDAHVYLPGIGTVSGLTAGNYLDSAGTTAASVDNPVGLSLDALQAMTLGSERAPALSAGNGWTVDAGWSLGTNQTTAASAGAGTATYKAIGSTNGNTYRITFTLSGYVSGSCYATLFNGVNGPAISANGTYTCTLTRNFVTDLAGVAAATANFTGTISGLSIKQVPGIHATQATTANKPILRRGLLNRFLRSQELSVSPWANGGTSPTITENAGLSASGAMTADRVKFPSGADSERYQNAALVSGQLFTIAAVIKSFSGSSEKFRFTANDFASNSADLTATATYQTFVYNFNATSSSPTAAGLRADSLNSAGDLLVDSIGIFAGTLTAQQIIDAGGIPLTTSAAASSATGKYWWQFDGSNDSLSLSAPLFQMADDHCVIAGFKADAANKYIFSHSHSGTVTQCCSLRVDVSGYPGAVWIDDASVNALPTATTSCIGLNTVATAIKIGNAKRLRVNGVQAGATNNTALGVGTTNTYAIGSLNGSSGNFQGSIYPIIAIKGTVSDSDLLTLERFVGQLSGVSI